MSAPCPSGKRRMTRKEAIASAQWWRRQRFARVNHYRCKKCGDWHIGNDRGKHAAKGTAR